MSRTETIDRTMDSIYIIEPMRLEDLDEVLAIEKATFRNPWPRELFVHEIEKNPNSHPTVARRKADEIAGYCVKWVVSERMHIQNIAVHPWHQRRGLGRFLLEEAMQCGRRAHAKIVQLEVRESNLAAQRLYDSFGFKRVGIRKRYYSNPREVAILYEKNFLDCDKV